jgi:hypothetical protein
MSQSGESYENGFAEDADMMPPEGWAEHFSGGFIAGCY